MTGRGWILLGVAAVVLIALGAGLTMCGLQLYIMSEI